MRVRFQGLHYIQGSRQYVENTLHKLEKEADNQTFYTYKELLHSSETRRTTDKRIHGTETQIVKQSEKICRDEAIGLLVTNKDAQRAVREIFHVELPDLPFDPKDLENKASELATHYGFAQDDVGLEKATEKALKDNTLPEPLMEIKNVLAEAKTFILNQIIPQLAEMNEKWVAMHREKQKSLKSSGHKNPEDMSLGLYAYYVTQAASGVDAEGKPIQYHKEE